MEWPKQYQLCPPIKVACLPPRVHPAEHAWVREQCSQDHTSSAPWRSALTVGTRTAPQGSAPRPRPFPGRISAVFILVLLNSYSAFLLQRKALLLPQRCLPSLWTELTAVPTLTCSCSIQPGHAKPEEDPNISLHQKYANRISLWCQLKNYLCLSFGLPL